MKLKRMASTMVLFSLCFSLILSSVSASAADSQQLAEPTSNKQVAILTSVQMFQEPQQLKSAADTIEKDPLYNGLFDKNGKIKEVNKNKLKKALLKKWSKDPARYAESIANIDSIAEKFANDLRAAQQHQEQMDAGGVVPMYEPICCYVTKTWYAGHPYITKTENWTYWVPWIVEDNYRSSIAVQVSTEKSTTTTTTIGFSGASEIKVKMNFSAQTSTSQTAKFTVGTTVPAWSVWAYRPYIKTKKDFWEGRMSIEYYNVAEMAWVYTGHDYEGVNESVTYKANEYYSRTNSLQSTTASTPMPPTTAP